MTPPSEKTLITIACIVAAVLLFPYAVIVGVGLYRPMFHPEFGFEEFRALPRMKAPMPEWVDTKGNFVLVDSPLNLVLVVLLADQTPGEEINDGFQKALPYLREIWGNASRSQTDIPVADNKRITINRSRNQLFVVVPDGNVLSASLRYPLARRFITEFFPVDDYADCILDGIEKHFSPDEPAVEALVLQARESLEQWPGPE